METIKRRCIVFAAFAAFGILAYVMLLFFKGAASKIPAPMLPAGVMIASGILAVFFIRECRKLKTARLIAENPILRIRTAEISSFSAFTEPTKDTEKTEVVISYFGILLDTKIIKFNQDGIRLRAVEIGEDFISFTYGSKKRMKNTRLMRPPIDPEAMEKIAESFRYETGIKPTFFFNGRKQNGKQSLPETVRGKNDQAFFGCTAIRSNAFWPLCLRENKNRRD